MFLQRGHAYVYISYGVLADAQHFGRDAGIGEAC